MSCFGPDVNIVHELVALTTLDGRIIGWKCVCGAKGDYFKGITWKQHIEKVTRFKLERS